MVIFGVPVEISSDGGPEFVAAKTKAFFQRWGIRQRISSVSFPSSNGRAELGVKTAKRLLMDNISSTGKLDTDGMVRALLTYRNTPATECKLSPAQILLGRPLRDTLPYISKDVMLFNNPEVHPQWKEAWKAKKDALKARYIKTLEMFLPDDLHVKSPEIPDKETDTSDSTVAHSPEVVYTPSRLSFGDLDVPQSISTDSDAPTNVCMQLYDRSGYGRHVSFTMHLLELIRYHRSYQMIFRLPFI